jgi:hypothetical protein
MANLSGAALTLAAAGGAVNVTGDIENDGTITNAGTITVN